MWHLLKSTSLFSSSSSHRRCSSRLISTIRSSGCWNRHGFSKCKVKFSWVLCLCIYLFFFLFPLYGPWTRALLHTKREIPDFTFLHNYLPDLSVLRANCVCNVNLPMKLFWSCPYWYFGCCFHFYHLFFLNLSFSIQLQMLVEVYEITFRKCH